MVIISTQSQFLFALTSCLFDSSFGKFDGGLVLLKLYGWLEDTDSFMIEQFYVSSCVSNDVYFNSTFAVYITS